MQHVLVQTFALAVKIGALEIKCARVSNRLHRQDQFKNVESGWH